MEKYKKWIYVVLLAFLFFEVLVVFPNKVGVSKDGADALDSQNSKKINTPGQKMQGVHLVEKDWELFSESAEDQQGKSVWNLKNVRVLFYKEEKLQFTVTGDQGAIDSATKDLQIRGRVNTQSENGYVFKTHIIRYSSQKKIITGPEHVEVLGPIVSGQRTITFNGDDLVAFVDENKMVVQKNIQAEKKLNDGKTIKITSDQIELSTLHQKVDFIGQVHMYYDQIKIDGPMATFNFIEKNASLDSIFVQGGAQVSDHEKVATSKTLNFNVLKNEMTFLGQPKVVQNDDVLSGEEIIFIDGGKKVKVQNVKATLEKK
ncbi:MAG: LPS export ABC transporter periplasmic protein LptC [Pseudobdellovibrionaceae bacterium]